MPGPAEDSWKPLLAAPPKPKARPVGAFLRPRGVLQGPNSRNTLVGGSSNAALQPPPKIAGPGLRAQNPTLPSGLPVPPQVPLWNHIELAPPPKSKPRPIVPSKDGTPSRTPVSLPKPKPKPKPEPAPVQARAQILFRPQAKSQLPKASSGAAASSATGQKRPLPEKRKGTASTRSRPLPRPANPKAAAATKLKPRASLAVKVEDESDGNAEGGIAAAKQVAKPKKKATRRPRRNRGKAAATAVKVEDIADQAPAASSSSGAAGGAAAAAGVPKAAGTSTTTAASASSYPGALPLAPKVTLVPTVPAYPVEGGRTAVEKAAAAKAHVAAKAKVTAKARPVMPAAKASALVALAAAAAAAKAAEPKLGSKPPWRSVAAPEDSGPPWKRAKVQGPWDQAEESNRKRGSPPAAATGSAAAAAAAAAATSSSSSSWDQQKSSTWEDKKPDQTKEWTWGEKWGEQWAKKWEKKWDPSSGLPGQGGGEAASSARAATKEGQALKNLKDPAQVLNCMSGHWKDEKGQTYVVWRDGITSWTTSVEITRRHGTRENMKSVVKYNGKDIRWGAGKFFLKEPSLDQPGPWNSVKWLTPSGQTYHWLRTDQGQASAPAAATAAALPHPSAASSTAAAIVTATAKAVAAASTFQRSGATTTNNDNNNNNKKPEELTSHSPRGEPTLDDDGKERREVSPGPSGTLRGWGGDRWKPTTNHQQEEDAGDDEDGEESWDSEQANEGLHAAAAAQEKGEGGEEQGIDVEEDGDADGEQQPMQEEDWEPYEPGMQATEEDDEYSAWHNKEEDEQQYEGGDEGEEGETNIVGEMLEKDVQQDQQEPDTAEEWHAGWMNDEANAVEAETVEVVDAEEEAVEVEDDVSDDNQVAGEHEVGSLFMSLRGQTASDEHDDIKEAARQVEARLLARRAAGKSAGPAPVTPPREPLLNSAAVSEHVDPDAPGSAWAFLDFTSK
mmetsp:Transcript_51186/g.108764  ORF Transcript_51186/g.108764 Transcript_51186/m.108764 type:complete len:956 (-) Transcript_51186:9-2876(-)